MLLMSLIIVLTLLCPGNNGDKGGATPSSDGGTCSSSSCQGKGKARSDSKPQIKTEKENSKYSKSSNQGEKDEEIPKLAYRTTWDHNWDRQYPKGNAKKPNSTRTIIIIRHGQFQLVQTDQDQSKPILTNVGKVQSKLTGKRLKAMNIPISHVYYSATVSAAETADQICKIVSCKNKEATKALAEGAPPIEPVPPINHWKPSKKVTTLVLFQPFVHY